MADARATTLVEIEKEKREREAAAARARAQGQEPPRQPWRPDFDACEGERRNEAAFRRMAHPLARC